MPFLPLDNVQSGPAEGERAATGLRKMYLLEGPEEMDLQPNLIQQLRDSVAAGSHHCTHTHTHHHPK